MKDGGHPEKEEVKQGGQAQGVEKGGRLGRGRTNEVGGPGRRGRREGRTKTRRK